MSTPLPSLPPVHADSPAMSRWINAVAERLNILSGDRVSVTRDLRVLADKVAAAPASKTIEQFAQELKHTQLYKDLSRRLDDPARFDSLVEEVRNILLIDLMAEAKKRGAEVSSLEHKFQSATDSLAYKVDEVTAAVESAYAGVREMSFASANHNKAQAGKITQVQARLDGVEIDPALIMPTVYATLAALEAAVPVGEIDKYYQVSPIEVTDPVTPNTLYRWDGTGYVVGGLGGTATVEQSMLATADRVKGISAEYMVKVNAGNAVAGFGLSASEDPQGNTESAFVIQADTFALTSSYTFAQAAAPTATAIGQTWYNTSTKLSYRSTATGTGNWASYTPIIPFGVDTTTGTVYINGSLKIGSGGGTTMSTVQENLNSIASDSILSPGEKPAVKQAYDAIIGEQAGLDAQAASYNITTTKSAYDGAITSLTNYLGTLTGWSTIPGSDVVINGANFRSYFTNVYAAKQALINKIAAEAGLRAVWTSVTDRPTSLATLDADAATQLDRKSVTYYQAAAPTGLISADKGDIWFDTDANYKMYSWTGSAWQEVQDSAAASAAASTAQTTADTKITTFYSTTTPTATTTGDLWYNTDTKLLKRWNGSTWDETATSGAPAGTLVNGVPVATITTAVTNFNASNDRTATAVTAPTIVTNGTAVDHTLQSDGSADVSFEWAWGGAEGDIDGFQVYVYQAATSTAYTMGTTAASETVYEVPANKRAFILFGVAANKYYTFGVRAYRAVDKDIAASGYILSTLVQPALAAENPYQPSTTVAFSGNVTGTINNIPAVNVNVWEQISGTGKPADNATVGATWGVNVGSRPSELTDGRIATAISSAGLVVSGVKPGIVVSAGTTAGLYMGSDYLGYYNGSAWKTYMDNSGNFYLGGTSGSLTWNGTTLNINGGGTFSGELSAATGSFGAVTVGASGSISSKKTSFADVTNGGFWIDSGGTSNAGRLHFGTTAANSIKWDGANLYINNTLASTVVSGAALGGTSIQQAALTTQLNTKLNNGAADVLNGTISFGSSGAFSIGNVVWTPPASAGLTGSATGSGTLYNQYGIVGVSAGVIKFVLDAVNGNAIFKGDITGASGAFSGTVSASNITAGTLTGSTLNTAASGKRIEISSATNDIKMYDAAGTANLTLTSGAAGTAIYVNADQVAFPAIKARHTAAYNTIDSENSNAAGVAISGTATHTTGANFGVRGETLSSAGRGVNGKSTAAGYAGYFDNPSGTAVYALGAIVGTTTLQVTGGFGCNTKTPQGAFAVRDNATDLATALTLVNQLRAILVANGICTTGG